METSREHRDGIAALVAHQPTAGDTNPLVSDRRIACAWYVGCRNPAMLMRFDPLDTASVEIYFQGKPQGVARLVDPVVNGQLPSPKPVSPTSPEPTGINFVELLHDKKDDDEESVPW